jgi:hypothetical protein
MCEYVFFDEKQTGRTCIIRKYVIVSASFQHIKEREREREMILAFHFLRTIVPHPAILIIHGHDRSSLIERSP